MLFFTMKLPRRKLAFFISAAAFCCCAALVLFLSPPQSRQAAAMAPPDPKGVRTNEERVAYLEGYGWQVSPQPTAVEELRIPEVFDESYTDYLTLQEGQGFSLADHSGKRVKRYSYEILNYPTGERGVVAHLLLRRNTVVGGEVLSPRLDGFLHGLAMP